MLVLRMKILISIQEVIYYWLLEGTSVFEYLKWTEKIMRNNFVSVISSTMISYVTVMGVVTGTKFQDHIILKAKFRGGSNEIIVSGRRPYFYSYDIETGNVSKLAGNRMINPL
jgi:hypothetical protein